MSVVPVELEAWVQMAELDTLRSAVFGCERCFFVLLVY